MITLAIIGLVAAITIPGLITNYKAHRLHSQFLKSYSTIQQAQKLIQEDELSLDEKDYSVHGSFYRTFAKYLAGSTMCGLVGENCFKNENIRYKYKNMNKRSLANSNFINYLDDGFLLLQDGTIYMFENLGGVNQNIMVSVDLNGYYSPPNMFGYDVFTFQVVDGSIKPMGALDTAYSDLDIYCNLNSKNDFNGIACAQKALSNSDYFKWVVKNIK